MAIPSEAAAAAWLRRASSPLFLVRIFSWLLGVGAIVWAVSALPVFLQDLPLDRAATEVLRRHILEEQVMTRDAALLDAVEQEPYCNPTALHDGVLLRVAMLNQAIDAANGAPVASSVATPLVKSARAALACMPGDSAAWLALFWVSAGNGALTPEKANYLRLSYAQAPNEGWIALWRVKIALSQFDRLPPDLATDAIEDFAKLVDTGMLFQETAAILAAAPPTAQSRIVNRVAALAPVTRELFARVLYDNGLKVDIPNTEIPGLRPWER